MGNKIKMAIEKNKGKIIVVLAIWMVLAVVFVGPVTISMIDANRSGINIISGFVEWFPKPLNALGASFSADIGVYFKVLFGFTFLYALAIIMAIAKAKQKSEYTDIEHGSSDWCSGGEQYQILSPKEGIILAEKNYLPLDKRGNINVLVIRRFWSW